MVPLAATVGLLGGAVLGPVSAEAGLFYCSTSAPTFNSKRSICEGVTAGGSQHQRAWIECLIPWYGSYRTYYGPTVGVLQYSTATAPVGATGCFGGYQLRP